MARILWVACSQPGSYFPAVPIAQELQRRGHRITVLCDQDSESTWRALGCDFTPTRRADATPPPAQPVTRESKLDWHRAYSTALHADTVEALRATHYDALMADPLEPGADLAAESQAVPCFSYVHWGMDEAGADVPFRFHFWDRVTPADEAFVAWWNEVRVSVSLPHESRPHDEHRWYRCSPQLTLVLGLPELVHPRTALPPYAVRVGPLVWDPPAHTPLPADLESIGRERPAVLASVSTIKGSGAELVVAVAEAAQAEDVDVVATVATATDLPTLPDNVRVLPFVPHSALIHRVALVAGHGGNGTVTRAACAGVPMLLFPGGRDQYQVAHGAVQAGVAISLGPEERDAAHTATALQRLLYEPGLRERAQQLAQVAATYDAPRSAADHVEELLRR